MTQSASRCRPAVGGHQLVREVQDGLLASRDVGAHDHLRIDDSFCNTGDTCAVESAIGAPCNVIAPSGGYNAYDSCEGDDVLCEGNGDLRCVKYGSAGERCSEPYERCVEGTACTNGLCRPNGPQNIFESKCGP